MYKFEDIVLSVSSILKIVFNLDNVEKTLLCFTYHVFFSCDKLAYKRVCLRNFVFE